MDDLSAREHQIALMVGGRGLIDKEVTHELGISCGTAKLHMHSILKKLGLRNRYGLFFWAMQGKTRQEHQRRSAQTATDPAVATTE